MIHTELFQPSGCVFTLSVTYIIFFPDFPYLHSMAQTTHPVKISYFQLVLNSNLFSGKAAVSHVLSF